MFCPLCESEFRAGFAECSDCHIALVATAAEAHGKSAELWRGESQERLDKILKALAAADIARHFKEGISRTPKFKLSYVDLARAQQLVSDMDEADRRELEED